MAREQSDVSKSDSSDKRSVKSNIEGSFSD